MLQVTFAGLSEDQWAESTRGLSPTDLTMNVVLPEIDGRIITRAVSFKEAGELDPLTNAGRFAIDRKPDRIDYVADLAARWAKLRTTPNAEKRVAIVLSNYPNRDGRIGNGVGLDTPASTVNVLNAMRNADYVLDGAPENGAALMELLLAGPTNARGHAVFQADSSLPALPLDDYARIFAALPQSVRDAVTARWGAPSADPFVRDSSFSCPRIASTMSSSASSRRAATTSIRSRPTTTPTWCRRTAISPSISGCAKSLGPMR